MVHRIIDEHFWGAFLVNLPLGATDRLIFFAKVSLRLSSLRELYLPWNLQMSALFGKLAN